MKVPLRYQNTEYDCGTTSFVNALAYLYDREDIPVELLTKYFVEYANKNDKFDVNCEILYGKDVTLDKIKDTVSMNGVVIARCYQDTEHYVLITDVDDNFTYIFDPYYLDEEYYCDDDDVAIVLHETFTHNRVVKNERLFDESLKDFSLLEKNKRSIILLKR